MDNGFLKEQIITYMGNKRKLLNIISDELDEIKKAMKKDKKDDLGTLLLFLQAHGKKKAKKKKK